MNLAIFDLDGTLTQTVGINDDAYLGALADLFSIVDVNMRWHEYEHVTDAGITIEIFRERFAREPESREMAAMSRRLTELLEWNVAERGASCVQVPGSGDALARLPLDAGWCVAIATGGWREPATRTMEMAGIDHRDIPAAFADDGISRAAIVTTAVARAARAHGGKGFEKIVSVGDGVWDVKTARELGIGFIGIGTGARADMMRREGATDLIEDYRDFTEFVRRLENATTPLSSVCNPSPVISKERSD